MGRMKKTEGLSKLRDEKLFKLIRNYLLVYLPVQREASQHTITNYRTVLSQYLSFTAAKNGVKLNSVTFDMFNRENVNSYLDFLTTEKNFSPATRNNRLAAIRAFVSYASACYPERLALESELSAIKVLKDDPFSKVDYMSENAVTALLNEPDVKTKIGLRDRFLMIFLYDSGARISEALAVRLCDIKFDSSPQVLLFGKGRKVRAVPLMEKTVEHLQQYLAAFHKAEPLTSETTLFYVLHGHEKVPMNDETVRARMQKYADSARLKCPEIPAKVHPHLWRHTRAMHLYQHGMDLSLVSQWLGHANLSTSLVYAYADTEHKRSAIEKAMGGEHSSISDTALCTVDDDELLKKLYGM
jgi:integrase/recombinase XerD